LQTRRRTFEGLDRCVAQSTGEL